VFNTLDLEVKLYVIDQGQGQGSTLRSRSSSVECLSLALSMGLYNYMVKLYNYKGIACSEWSYYRSEI